MSVLHSNRALSHTPVRRMSVLLLPLVILLGMYTLDVSAQGRIGPQEVQSPQQQEAILQQLNIKPCPAGVSPCVCRLTPAGPELECSGISDPAQLQLVIALQQPNHFHKIILQRSRTPELPSEAFGEATADIYVVQNNPLLESIDPGAFGQFANPKEVIVQRNPVLEEFPFNDLKKWLDLQKFVLADNRILEVPDYAFDGASPALKEIHLQRNVILDLGPLAFRGLSELQHLDLSGNQIASLGAGTLFFTEPIKTLDLSRNRIASIDVKAFEDPARAGSGSFAEYIDFSNNLFTFLEQAKWEGVFRKLDAFKTSLEEPVTTTTSFNPFLLLQQFQQLATTTAATPLTTTVLPVEPTGLEEKNPEALFFQFLQSLLERGVPTTPAPTTLSSTIGGGTSSATASSAFGTVLNASFTASAAPTNPVPSTTTTPATTTVESTTVSAAFSTTEGQQQQNDAVALNGRVGSIWTAILTELDQLIEARQAEGPGVAVTIINPPVESGLAVDAAIAVETTTPEPLGVPEFPSTTEASVTPLDLPLPNSLPPLTDALVSTNTVLVDKAVNLSLHEQQSNLLGLQLSADNTDLGQRISKALSADPSSLNSAAGPISDVLKSSSGSSKLDQPTWDTPGFDGAPLALPEPIVEAISTGSSSKPSNQDIQGDSTSEALLGASTSSLALDAPHAGELHAGLAQAKELFQESFLREFAGVPQISSAVTETSVPPSSPSTTQEMTSQSVWSTVTDSPPLFMTTTTEGASSLAPADTTTTTTSTISTTTIVLEAMPTPAPTLSTEKSVDMLQTELPTSETPSSTVPATTPTIPSTSMSPPPSPAVNGLLLATPAVASSVAGDPVVKEALDSIALLRKQLEAAIQSIPMAIAAALGGPGSAGLQLPQQLAPQLPTVTDSAGLATPLGRKKRAVEMALLSRKRRQAPIEASSSVAPEAKSIKGPPPAPSRPLFSINFNSHRPQATGPKLRRTQAQKQADMAGSCFPTNMRNEVMLTTDVLLTVRLNPSVMVEAHFVTSKRV